LEISMIRRNVLTALVASLTLPTLGRAQQSARLNRVGVLIDGSAPHPMPDVLKATLAERGYVEGRTVTYDIRYAEGEPARAEQLAAELVKSGVHIIVAHFTPAVRAAMKSTTTIPIVMAPAGAPVQTKLIASLSRPGGNVTGVTNMAAELGGRRLQLLKDINPKLARVAVLASSTDAFTAPFLSYLQEAAASGGIALDVAKLGGPEEFEATFARFAAAKADAVMVQGVFNSQRARIVELSGRHRLLTMWFDRQAVEAGGLISLSANTADIYKRAALMVDRILKGAKPGELPVEQPAIFELVVNMKTARDLGIAIPQSVSIQVDHLIE
jgi:putative ABC transport system substrate-binding protein